MNGICGLLRRRNWGVVVGVRGRRKCAGGGGRGLLPILFLAVATLAAHAQYQFRIEVNPDGTLTVYQGVSCLEDALIIPDTIDGRKVTSIGDGAFQGCYGLTTITIPESVTSIGEKAFSDCDRLTSVTIPDSVTSIGTGAFFYCPHMADVTIGNGVTSIGDGVFSACYRLTTITVGPLDPAYASVDGVLLDKGRTVILAVPMRKGGKFDIPDSVTSIGEGAFSGRWSLTSITIGSGVTSIGHYAFSGCTGLTSITIPDSVTSIGDEAFRGCTSLISVTIGNGVTTIPVLAFSKCTGLTTVRIGNGVLSIGTNAFDGCTGLTNVTILDSVTSIESSAFSGCIGLTTIKIPDTVTAIGDWAFAGCTALKDVYFAGDVPKLRWNSAFYDPTIIRYLPGTAGWASTFSGRPTAPWVRPQPTILAFGDRFGPSTNGFSFVISWATNVPVVVEGSADIGSAAWTRISTNTLTDGWVQFTDPDWTNLRARFYRVRGQ